MQPIKTTQLNRICIDDSFLEAVGHYLHEKQSNAVHATFLTEKNTGLKILIQPIESSIIGQPVVY